MSVKTADRSLAHLFPPFREKLERVLHDLARDTLTEWIVRISGTGDGADCDLAAVSRPAL